MDGQSKDRTSVNPGTPDVSAAGLGSVGAPTLAEGQGAQKDGTAPGIVNTIGVEEYKPPEPAAAAAPAEAPSYGGPAEVSAAISQAHSEDRNQPDPNQGLVNATSVSPFPQAASLGGATPTLDEAPAVVGADVAPRSMAAGIPEDQRVATTPKDNRSILERIRGLFHRGPKPEASVPAQDVQTTVSGSTPTPEATPAG